jgi:antitoxin (DNA-binding transcriptional repressor) of toxin-antitoxin stability system
MTQVFNMHEAKTNLSKLVELVESGQEVQIARNGNAIVNLVLTQKKSRPLFGEFEPIHGEIPKGFDIDAQMPEWEKALLEKDKFLKPAQTSQNT